MPNPGRIAQYTGRPVRLKAAGMVTAIVGVGDDQLFPPGLQAVDPRKSYGGFTIKLWGAGGGEGHTGLAGTPGCGASLYGTLKAGSLSFKVGDTGAPGAQGLYGSGKGGLCSAPTNYGSGGGGSGVYLSDGTLFGVAGGGGGSAGVNGTFYGQGGDAGALADGSGKGGHGTYTGQGTTWGVDGSASGGGAGGNDWGSGVAQYLGGPGGGGGSDGSGGGGGALCAVPYGG
ncbi:MAG: hypothetical protein JKY27_11440, partial [Magnetovibrio sp.]|nr:hypothetical protein [Magnetovibrio sp.]